MEERTVPRNQTTDAKTDKEPTLREGENSVRAPKKHISRGKRPERGRGERRRRGGKPRERIRSEYEQKIVSIRRVTRVVAGGRRFSFSVALIAGNKKGSVGVGSGKAQDTALAIDKALRNAKKNMITLPVDENMAIPHAVEGKYASSVVQISPARGRGLVAGSSVRTVLELAGVRDVTAKLLSRSKNRLNNAMAALRALEKIKTKNVRK